MEFKVAENTGITQAMALKMIESLGDNKDEIEDSIIAIIENNHYKWVIHFDSDGDMYTNDGSSWNMGDVSYSYAITGDFDCCIATDDDGGYIEDEYDTEILSIASTEIYDVMVDEIQRIADTNEANIKEYRDDIKALNSVVYAAVHDGKRGRPSNETLENIDSLRDDLKDKIKYFKEFCIQEGFEEEFKYQKYSDFTL